jgi:hypothetical protein
MNLFIFLELFVIRASLPTENQIQESQEAVE